MFPLHSRVIEQKSLVCCRTTTHSYFVKKLVENFALYNYMYIFKEATGNMECIPFNQNRNLLHPKIRPLSAMHTYLQVTRVDSPFMSTEILMSACSLQHIGDLKKKITVINKCEYQYLKVLRNKHLCE